MLDIAKYDLKRCYKIYIKKVEKSLLWNSGNFRDFMKKTRSHNSFPKIIFSYGISSSDKQEYINTGFFFKCFSSLFSINKIDLNTDNFNTPYFDLPRKCYFA